MDGGKRIGLREIRALGTDRIIWDGAVAGFGARRRSGTTVVYLVKYRTAGGRQRWQVIGRHGAPWTPETAREKAKAILGDVADGADPAAEKRAARKAKTVAELCDLYLADAEAGRLLTRRKVAKKASTLATDRGRIVSGGRGAFPGAYRMAQRRGTRAALVLTRPCPAHSAARRHENRAVDKAALACGVRRAI
jgi:Arm domain-containing DNA-binding protein